MVYNICRKFYLVDQHYKIADKEKTKAEINLSKPAHKTH